MPYPEATGRDEELLGGAAGVREHTVMIEMLSTEWKFSVTRSNHSSLALELL